MINIKGGGVHLWYMMFGQQCSISVVFSINFKSKGWGNAMLGETLHIYSTECRPIPVFMYLN